MADKITKEWLRIAAGMIDAKRATAGHNSSPDEVQAMAWLFDNGIFYLGEAGMREIKDALLERYASTTTRGDTIHAAE